MALKTATVEVQAAGSNIEALLTLAKVTADVDVAKTQTEISRQEAEFDSLKKRYKRLHPKYIEAEGRLAFLRTQLTNFVLKMKSTSS